MCFLSIIYTLSSLSAQTNADGEQLLKETISTWQVLNTNIQIKSLKNHLSPDSVRTLSGSGTFFGQNVGLEVAFKGTKEIRRVMIDFPALATITTDHFRQLIGKDFNAIFPQGFGTGIGIKHFEIDVESKKVQNANIIMTFGTWAPDSRSASLKLSAIEGEFGLMDIQSREPNVVVGLNSQLLLPKDAANYIGIGTTTLDVNGYVNTQTMKIALGAKLTSEEIPLVSDKSVVLKEARFQFYFETGKAGLALGGQMQIRPPGEAPITLNGEISVDITGKIYGEAWMDQDDYIQNPFGISDKIFIEKAGLGFGVDFKTTPIPAPSIAIEGGISVRDSRTSAPRFSGSVTMGIDATQLNKTMIDAEVGPLYLADIVDVFHPSGPPAEFADVLRKISFQKLHMTVVPPGAPITLFGRTYEPGFYAEGIFNYEDFTGAMFIDISEAGVEAFGGMSPIIHPGFALTGTAPGTGPHIYLALKPAEQVLALAVNGKLEVLGASALADIYLSDAGFNALVRAEIMGGFTAALDIAGTDLLKGGSIYVKASMTAEDNLVQKITREASDEINRMANETQRDVDNATRMLESLRPQLNAKASKLAAKQEEVRREYQYQCGLIDQKANQERERAQKTQQINNLKAEINRLEAALSTDRFRSAKPIKSTTCGGNSKQFGDYCYTCPQGFEWNGPIPLNDARGCIKRGTTLYAKATYSKTAPCNPGQIFNFPNAGCYDCPAGYRPSEAVIDINASNRCYKVVPDQFAYPVKGESIACTGRSFPDLTTGKCWECPSGYERKATFESITGPKACELVNLAGREATIRNKRLELAGLETSLVTITNGIGELATKLSGVATDVCQKVNNTEAINLDYRVAPIFAEWSALSLTVNEYQDIVKFSGEMTVNGLRATAWIARHGGEALGVVQINSASFEGCLSTVNGGYVAMKITGKFADQPISGSFDINLNSPEAGIKALANILMGTNYPVAVRGNGTCTRPIVSRPDMAGTKIADMLATINKGANNKLSDRPQKETRPTWTGKRQFDETWADPAKFDVRTNNATSGDNPSGSSSGSSSGSPSGGSTGGFVRAGKMETNVAGVFSISVGNQAFTYFNSQSKTSGNLYQMKPEGKFGTLAMEHTDAPDSPSELAVSYQADNRTFIMLYKKQQGEVYRIPLKSDGSPDYTKGISQAGWRQNWDHMTSFRLGGKTYLFCFDNVSGIAEVYEVSGADDATIVATTSTINFGPGYIHVTVAEVGSSAYLIGYHQSGYIALFEVKAGGIFNPNGTYAMRNVRQTWSALAPYRVGGKTYLHLYDKSTGDTEIYPIQAGGTLGDRTYLSTGWMTDWDVVIPYNVGNKIFNLYYHKATGNSQIWELTPDGKFGNRTAAYTRGDIQAGN